MDNVGNFIDILSASYPEGTEHYCISLKSALLVFIIHTEILSAEGKSLSDVMHYYDSGHDYLDFTTDLILDDNTVSSKPLLKYLSGTLDTAMHLAINNNVHERGKPLPKLSVKVDITGIPSELGIIDVEGSTSSTANIDSNNIYTLKLMQQINNNKDLTETQIHNLKLVDFITRITSTSGGI